MEKMEVEEYRITDKFALHNANLCENCKKPLSIPPIYCMKHHDSSVTQICGRCYYIVHKQVEHFKWRQHAYENVAQFLTFPCAYKSQGCNEILKWKETIEHEANCKYPIIKCPANDNEFYVGFYCPWEGSAQLLNNHIRETHQGTFIDPPHFDELPATSEVYFTRACDTIFMIVFLKSDDKKYGCCVLVRGGELSAQMYRYQIELFDSTKTNSIILRRNKVENWFSVESTLCNKNNILEIDCNVIENLIKHNCSDKRISAKIGIVKKSRKEIKQIFEAAGRSFQDAEHASHQKPRVAPDEKLLSELECPVCNEYMVPPIYICSNGHSLCSECLTKVQTCPNCRCALGNTRNFTLEKMTTKVLYTCRNKEAGCAFVTTSENIREHESSCNLTTIPCLLKCGQDFRKEQLWPHVTAKHQESILNTGEIHKRDVHDKKESHFVFFTCGELFRFSIKGSSNQQYKFNVQWMADEKQKAKFTFALEIIDKSPYKLIHHIVNLVQPMNETPFKTGAVIIPWDMIKPFVLENARHFHFRYNITPIDVTASV